MLLQAQRLACYYTNVPWYHLQPVIHCMNQGVEFEGVGLAIDVRETIARRV